MGFFFKSRKERAERKEAELLAPQFLKHVNESIDLVNSTKNPETFFSRYDFLIERLSQLMELEKIIDFTGESPSDTFERVMLEKSELTNIFLRRYCDDVLTKASGLKTDKAKERRIEKFCSSLKIYEEKTDAVNIEKLDELILYLKDELDIL